MAENNPEQIVNTEAMSSGASSAHFSDVGPENPVPKNFTQNFNAANVSPNTTLTNPEHTANEELIFRIASQLSRTLLQITDRLNLRTEPGTVKPPIHTFSG